MGALSHYLENEGLATAGISLVRLHTEKIRPPRALWVPFELGRPLGTPDDAPFQTRVLQALIALLETPFGPVLSDYPEEAPAADPGDMTGMVCTVSTAPSQGETSLADRVCREVADLRPWYDLSRERRGRTTFGSAGLDVNGVVSFLVSWLDGAPPSPVPTQSPDAVLKLAVEDIKAFYLEAAQAQPGPKDSRKLYDWFWTETSAAHLIVDIRQVCLMSDDAPRRLMGNNYLVPRAYWEHFGIDGSVG